jgi:hypothetical protein
VLEFKVSVAGPNKDAHAVADARPIAARPRSNSMRKLIFVLASVAMLSLNACGKSIDTAEWTEEVKLSDGTMVTVWRKARAYSGGFPNAPRGAVIDFEFKYAPLDLHWSAKASQTSAREPVSFDIIDGVPHLALYVDDRDYCRERPPTQSSHLDRS